MAKKNIIDLEKDKFDANGRVKVALDATADQDVVITNTSSNPVPVSIINPSDAIDLQVEIQPNITIDDSTPIDVNVTNTSVDVNITALDGDGDLGVKIQNASDINVNVTNTSLNTNATIQNANLDVNLTDLDVNGRLPVSVDNQPTVTVGNSNLDVTLQNSSINTNATIQNSNLNVTVQNPFQYVYDMVYDGSQWRFQLSDSNGKAINLSHTYYTSAEITALGASTDINLWLSAYNDSMLQNKWVASYNNEFEETVYYQHPSLGNGTKCLRLVYQYSTQNTQTVVESIVAAVADWSYSDDIIGSVSVSVTNQVDPNPNNAIPVHTKVADLAFTVNTVGTATISLSGTNASLYHIYDTTTSTGFSSGTFSSSGVYELHVASDYSGSSYSHSLNIDIVGDLLGSTDSATLSISGTYTGVTSFANTKYLSGTGNTTILGAYGEQLNKGFFGTSGTQTRSATRTVAFWAKLPTLANSTGIVLFGDHNSTSKHTMFIRYSKTSTGVAYLYWHTSVGTNQTNMGYSTTNPSYENTWTHFAWSLTNTSDVQYQELYINGVLTTFNYNFDNWYANQADFSITDSNILGVGYYNSVLDQVPNMSGFDIKLDEIVCFSPALDETNNDEITELYTGSKTGTTGTVFDYANHSQAANIYRHLRFGDLSGDSESAVTCRIDSSISYDKQSGLTGTYINNLTSSDTPYVPASGAWANDYYALGSTDATCRLKLYADFDLSNSWTISFWVYASAYSSLTYLNSFFPITTLTTSSHTDGTYSTTFPNGLYGAFRNNTGQSDYFGFVHDNNSNANLVGWTNTYSASRYLAGKWNNVIITWDSTYYNASSISQSSVKNGLKWYINNTVITPSADYAPTATINPSDYVFTGISFGAHSAPYISNKYYNGRLDGVAIWTSTLVTSTERGLIYNSGTPQDLMNTSGLTSPTKYWIMEDNTDLTYDVKNSASNQGNNTNFVRTAH